MENDFQNSMGLFSYMGHRLLGIGLVFFSAILFLAGMLSGSMWMTVVALVVAVAGAYFFKTSH